LPQLIVTGELVDPPQRLPQNRKPPGAGAELTQFWPVDYDTAL